MIDSCCEICYVRFVVFCEIVTTISRCWKALLIRECLQNANDSFCLHSALQSLLSCSVCLSVCPSHAGIVLKWLSLGRWGFHGSIVQRL